jgi:hypothetical protein
MVHWFTIFLSHPFHPLLGASSASAGTSGVSGGSGGTSAEGTAEAEAGGSTCRGLVEHVQYIYIICRYIYIYVSIYICI